MRDFIFQKTRLANGLRVLTERHPHVHSATLGVWAAAGSICETDEERGLAHLLEHLVFKGTQTRSAHRIATDMDRIGGQMNAFTEKEFVCYHAKVLAEHAPLAMQLLCDLVTHPLLNEDDLELEKRVIIEEIKAIEDAPEELVQDLFTETIWSRSRWGRSILGTPASVAAFEVQDVRRFVGDHYHPGNVMVVAVGQVEHEDIVEQAERLLKDLPARSARPRQRQPRQPTVTAHQVQLARDTEQVHLCCGTRSYAFDDPRRFASWALDSILTSGYSSRLFQEIREKRGLCYSIGPLSACYRTAGFWAVETSVAPKTAGKVTDLIGRELRRVKASGVTKQELNRSKQMARANILLSEESSSTQMSRIARNELYYGRQKPTDEVLSELMAVTLTGVHEAANDMFDSSMMNTTSIGPFAETAEPLLVDVG